MDENKYNEYPLESSLTGDDYDEKPLVSGFDSGYEPSYESDDSSWQDSSWQEEDYPLNSSGDTRPVRSRKETIRRIADEQQNGQARAPGLRAQVDRFVVRPLYA